MIWMYFELFGWQRKWLKIGDNWYSGHRNVFCQVLCAKILNMEVVLRKKRQDLILGSGFLKKTFGKTIHRVQKTQVSRKFDKFKAKINIDCCKEQCSVRTRAKYMSKVRKNKKNLFRLQEFHSLKISSNEKTSAIIQSVKKLDKLQIAFPITPLKTNKLLTKIPKKKLKKKISFIHWSSSIKHDNKLHRI